MLVAIDGTACLHFMAAGYIFPLANQFPFFKNHYLEENRGGFVSQMAQDRHIPNSFYHIGPTISGVECGLLADGVVARILWTKMRKKDPIIYMAGYSRGAAIAILAAWKLKADGHRIKAMFLFDGVDRDALSYSRVVPGNVEYAYHAMRDPEVHSRDIFGTDSGLLKRKCGMLAESGVKLEIRRDFWTTHAGMGGLPGTGDHPKMPVVVPAPTTSRSGMFGTFPVSTAEAFEPTISPEEEFKGSQDVAKWMGECIKNHLVMVSSLEAVSHPTF